MATGWGGVSSAMHGKILNTLVFCAFICDDMDG